MTASATSKLKKRLERAESIAIGMGFLLLKLRQSYGGDFSYGMTEQVNQAIADYMGIKHRRVREIIGIDIDVDEPI